MRKLIISLISVILFIPAFGQVMQDTSFIANYPFNGNANDESGNENHGEVVGALLTTDRFGNEDAAYEFDGMSGYISIPSSESLQKPTSELTEMAWIYLYSWSLVNQPFGPVFMKSNSSGNQFQYRLSVGPDGINIAINNWGNFVTIADSLEFEKWYFIAATWADDTARVYVDGTFLGEGYLQGPAMTDGLALEIGRDVPGSTEFFHGKIDDARLYSRALETSEIEAIYEGSYGISLNPDQAVQVIISPNPSDGLVKVIIRNFAFQRAELRVYNSGGVEVASFPAEKLTPGTYVRQLYFENLPSGVYIYVLQTESESIRGKLIIGR